MAILEQRVMVFIDGSNLHHAIGRYQKTDPSFAIDYEKLIGELVAGRRLIRSYYYGSRPKQPDAKQESFYKKLQRIGIEVFVKTLKARKRTCRECKKTSNALIEKGVDVALVTDLLAFGFRDGYDTAIIVSGDNDFIQAINEVKRMPKRVEIVCFSDSINEETERKADAFTPLESLTHKIRLQS